VAQPRTVARPDAVKNFANLERNGHPREEELATSITLQFGDRFSREERAISQCERYIAGDLPVHKQIGFPAQIRPIRAGFIDRGMGSPFIEDEDI
jgi:hypothetical protein